MACKSVQFERYTSSVYPILNAHIYQPDNYHLTLSHCHSPSLHSRTTTTEWQSLSNVLLFRVCPVCRLLNTRTSAV